MDSLGIVGPESGRRIIEDQLREIHADLDTVEFEDGTGRAVMVLESGEEMVRAEFESDSETYRLLKLYESTLQQ